MAAPEAFPDLRRITQANKELVDIAKTLLDLAAQVDNPAANETLRRTVKRLLDISGDLNSAASNAARVARS